MTVRVRTGGSFLRNKARTYVLFVFNLLFHYCPIQKLTQVSTGTLSDHALYPSISFLPGIPLFLQGPFRKIPSSPIPWLDPVPLHYILYRSLSSSLYCVSNLWLSIPPVFKFMRTRYQSFAFVSPLSRTKYRFNKRKTC